MYVLMILLIYSGKHILIWKYYKVPQLVTIDIVDFNDLYIAIYLCFQIFGKNHRLNLKTLIFKMFTQKFLYVEDLIGIVQNL